MQHGTLREFINHLSSFCDEVKDKPFVLKNKNGVFCTPMVYMVDKDGNTEISMPIEDISEVTIQSK